ncbi:hypothetical protein MMC25_002760 [Agyrium rufum]|nr:hypothetical protein [Agyrium rufum]
MPGLISSTEQARLADAMSHTPLEILLLVLSLRRTGINGTAFTAASDSMRENEFLKDTRAYEAGRLKPESLKQLFLSVLKEEVRTESGRSASPVTTGVQNPRKRKLSTPPLRSVDDAAEHTHILPQLVTRLYEKYQNWMIGRIEHDEKEYLRARDDLEAIERGEWDPRFEREQDQSKRKDERDVSSIRALLRTESGTATSQRDKGGTSHPQLDSSVPQNGNRGGSHTPYIAVNDPQWQGTGTISMEAYQKSDTSRSRQSSANGSVPAKSPIRDPYGHYPSQPSVSRIGNQVPPHIPSTAYSGISPSPDLHRRSSQHSQRSVPPALSPRTSQANLRTSASPITLPPVPGMLRSQTSSNESRVPYPENRLDQQPSPHPAHSIPQACPPHPPGPAQPYGQLPVQPTLTPQGYPYAAPYPPPQQILPPRNFPPEQGRISPYASQGSLNTPGVRQPHYLLHQLPYNQYYPYAPEQMPYPAGIPYNPVHHASPHQPFLPHTPVVPSSGRPRPPRPSPIETPGSATKWKTAKTPVPKEPNTGNRPNDGDVSPISYHSPSPAPDVPESLVEETIIANSDETRTPTSAAKALRGRSGRPPSRGKKKLALTPARTTNTRPIPSRSPSLASRTDSQPPLPARQKIKAEELPTTPVTSTGRSPPISLPPASSSRKQAMTISRTAAQKRKRAPTISETPDPSASNTSRDPVTVSTPTPRIAPITRTSTHVLASRNFGRTSATIMNDITTHKLASMFAKPLTERDAPGYKDLIYRSQDLKSIRSAVSTGNRAVAAAMTASSSTVDQGGSSTAGTGAEDVVPPSTPGGSGAIWIEYDIDQGNGLDVVPPKGIVNSAQLEKEVMRMFANAVMFNPGTQRGLGLGWRKRTRRFARNASGKTIDRDDDFGSDDEYDDNGGEDESEEEENEEESTLAAADAVEGAVVRDTREMFSTVDAAIGVWRGAERGFEGFFAPPPPAAATTGGGGGTASGDVTTSATPSAKKADEGESEREGTVITTTGAGTAEEDNVDEGMAGRRRKRRRAA